jgi:CheY-like chemotaxis protein/HPt (histidine-containing phosphotransfer) domain-containing protein/PAS domain-containing protein
MTDTMKAYVGQLKEKLDLINETIALTQKTAVLRATTLQEAREYLLHFVYRVLQREQIPPKEIFDTVAEKYPNLGVICTGPDGKIIHASATARELLGQESLGEKTDDDSTYFLADKVTPCGKSLPWKRAAEGMQVSEVKVFVKRADLPDGLWLQVDALPIKDHDGFVRCAIGLLIDITEDVQAENQIYDVRRSLEQRLTATANAHEDLALLAGKLGRPGWTDAVESPEEIVLMAAQSNREKEKLVLVVDDVRVHHILLGSYLTNMGYTVHSASNGHAAVEAVKKHNYSLILMDCDMPVMDGYEATRQIRAGESSGKRVPIIAMTIYDRAGDREKCLEVGMDDYVVKNSDQTKLLKVMETVLKGDAIPQAGVEAKKSAIYNSEGEIDVPALEKLIGPKLRTEILPLFLKTTSLLIECLRPALAFRDVRATHHYAYCIKGPAASFGCTKLTLACEKVAEAALRNKWFDCDLEFDSLEATFDEVAKQCEAELAGVDIGTASKADKLGGQGETPAVFSVAKLEQKIGKPTTQLLAKAFLEDTNDLAQTMGSGIARKDQKSVQMAAHKLAGCCASIMDTETQGLAKQVEELVRNQSWQEISETFLSLRKSIDRTRVILKEYTKKWWHVW